jgi:hypothetical protein
MFSRPENSGLNPVHAHFARRGLRNTRHELEGRALARAILTDDAEHFAAPYGEAQIAQSPELAVKRAAAEEHEFLQALAGGFVDRVALRDAVEFDGIHVRSSEEGMAR